MLKKYTKFPFLFVCLAFVAVATLELVNAEDLEVKDYVIIHSRESLARKTNQKRRDLGLNDRGKINGQKGTDKTKLNALASYRVQEKKAIAQRRDNHLKAIASRGIDLRAKQGKSHFLAADVTYLKNLTLKEVARIKAMGIEIRPKGERKLNLEYVRSLLDVERVWTEVTDINGDAVTGKGVSIAIIDSGMDITHEAFGNCTWDMVDAGTCARVKGGKNFIDPSAYPTDDNLHGTHVGGIVGGSGRIKGVAPDVEFYSLKVCFGPYGLCDEEAIVSALEFAMDPNGDDDTSDHLDIVNMSLGGVGDPSSPDSIAAQAAYEAGVLVLAAAGNSGNEIDMVGSPAVAPGVIAVASTSRYQDGRDDEISYFSSGGPNIWLDGGYENRILKPDIAAPGEEVCSALWTGSSLWPGATADLSCGEGYERFSGTSMATPVVAGVAALLMQKYPDWTPQELRTRLVNSTDKLIDSATITPYPHRLQGHGRINALRAVSGGDRAVADIEPRYSPAINIIDITGIASGDNFIRYELAIRGDSQADIDANWHLLATGTSEVSGGVLGTLDTTTLEEIVNILRLRVVTASGSYDDYEILSVLPPNMIVEPVDYNFQTKHHITPAKDPVEVRGIVRDAAGFTSYSLEWCWYDHGMVGGTAETQTPGLLTCSAEGVTLANNGGQSAVPDIATLGYIDFVAARVPHGPIVIRVTSNVTGKDPVYSISRILIDTDLKLPAINREDRDNFSYAIYGNYGKLTSNGPSRHIFTTSVAAPNPDDGFVPVIAVEGNNFAVESGWPKSLVDILNPSIYYQRFTSADDTHNAEFVFITFGDSIKVYRLDNEGNLLANYPVTLRSDPSIDYAQVVGTLVLEDLDGDGQRELITGDLEVFRADGSVMPGWDPRATDYVAPINQERTWAKEAVVVGDVTGDGLPEVVAVSQGFLDSPNLYGTCSLYVFRHDGTVIFSQKLQENAWNCYFRPSLTDHDGDGIKDIRVFNSQQSFFFKGDGQLIGDHGYQQSNVKAYTPGEDFVVGDVTGDGIDDLVLRLILGFKVFDVTAPGMVREIKLKYRPNSRSLLVLANLDEDPALEIFVYPDPSNYDDQPLANGSFWWQFAYNYDGSVVHGYPRPAVLPDATFKRPIIADLDEDGLQELVMFNTLYDMGQYELNVCTPNAPSPAPLPVCGASPVNYRTRQGTNLPILTAQVFDIEMTPAYLPGQEPTAIPTTETPAPEDTPSPIVEETPSPVAEDPSPGDTPTPVAEETVSPIADEPPAEQPPVETIPVEDTPVVEEPTTPVQDPAPTDPVSSPNPQPNPLPQPGPSPQPNPVPGENSGQEPVVEVPSLLEAPAARMSMRGESFTLDVVNVPSLAKSLYVRISHTVRSRAGLQLLTEDLALSSLDTGSASSYVSSFKVFGRLPIGSRGRGMTLEFYYIGSQGEVTPFSSSIRLRTNSRSRSAAIVPAQVKRLLSRVRKQLVIIDDSPVIVSPQIRYAAREYRQVISLVRIPSNAKELWATVQQTVNSVVQTETIKLADVVGKANVVMSGNIKVGNELRGASITFFFKGAGGQIGPSSRGYPIRSNVRGRVRGALGSVGQFASALRRFRVTAR